MPGPADMTAPARVDAVPRELEAAAVAALLSNPGAEPAGLVISGEAGIGKTTLLLAARQDAADREFVTLSARGDPGEVRLAFAALADLLADVEHDVIELLPPLQQAAVNRVLLRNDSGPALDERAVATAFHNIVLHLASRAPVLIAIDDLQWLDTSSAAAVRFAARRLSGPVRMLLSVRTGEPGADAAMSWLQLPRPDAVVRLTMSPLSLGGVHLLLANRLGRVFPRPTMTRIHAIAKGNPLYALELARTVIDGHSIDRRLPDSLAALVRARVQNLDAETARVLLAAACTPAPSVQLIAAATQIPGNRVVELLEDGDAASIVMVVGERIQFAHPLLATGVYASASAADRRRMHGRLADCVDAPELKARHLASAAVRGDRATLAALDDAAALTRSRGAPAAAAELLELAITLGGDTPQRRIQAAEHHFRAGAPGPARRLLEPTIESLPPGDTRCLALMLLGAVLGYGDDTVGAAQALIRAADEAQDNSELRLHCLLRVALVTVMIGQIGQAVEYAEAAMALADRLGSPDLRSRALSIWVLTKYMSGAGVDLHAIQLALELEDPRGDATSWYRASAAYAMILAWTGDLAGARREITAEQQRMLNGGTEIDIIWVANHLATIDVWLGRYADAAQASRDAVQRAEQMGGLHLLVTAWGWQAAIAAYTGNEAEARTAATAAITTAREIGAQYLIEAPSATLAFLEVSLGNYDAAVAWVEPQLARFTPPYGLEINTGGHLPDSIEALTNLDRVEEAELLVSALQDNGIRLNRPWMLAVAARGRAQCLAARGDLPAAEDAAAQAITHHRLLPMPFETARTQLLLGQLQRRRRRRQPATENLTQALAIFEDIGSPLWAARARTELARVSGASGQARSELSPAERRIAERAAAGLSNKEIAAEQFLAPKTVEMTLSSVYRKLGIRSRTQLHSRLNETE